MAELDNIDRAILRLLSADASLSLNDIADKVGLTATPCWKRIKHMEEAGIIRARVAVLDADKLGLPVSVFVSVETADHSAEWLARFADTIATTPEIVGAWRDERRCRLPAARHRRGYRGLRCLLPQAYCSRAAAQRLLALCNGTHEGRRPADLIYLSITIDST